MPNSFDFDPRSPSNGRLFVFGVCFIVVATLSAMAAIAKSNGRFDDLVSVDVELVNVGDGLPARSDVKFRGVLVGSVADITPSQHGRPNLVHVNLRPEYASGIPNTVTARVIPSNAFAVSAVQLVDNGKGAGSLRSGSIVHEDKSLPTVLFQNVLAKLRELLAAVGRKPDDATVGVLATLGQATHGRGQQLTDAGHDLNEIMAQLNSVVSADNSGPSTLSALTAAADGLRGASPELFDALDTSIRPMRTFAEKRGQLHDFLSGGLRTTGTLGDAFDHQTDRLIAISTELTPALGLIADHADQFHGISTRMQVFANKFYDNAWDPDRNSLVLSAVFGFTPTRSYVRADCPRYGALAGPSCQTAPEVPTAPDLLPALGSMGYPPTPGLSENRPNFAPPRGSIRGAPEEPAPPGPPPGALPPPLESPSPPTSPTPPDVQPQSAVIGGNVGPVGSPQEKQQLGRILGGNANATTELLFGPLARGATVHISPDPGAGR
jgi:phospholipid/cholesterol/gamma-HCH transport system substrate-binding protein